MKLTTPISSVAALALLVALPSCGDTNAQTSSPGDAAVTETAEVESEDAVVELEPDPKTILTRSADRWNYVTNGDWIQVYDFFSDQRQVLEKLPAFLGGKEYHEYENASKPVFVGIEDGLGFVEVSVDWTPHHPELMVANNLPDDPDGMRQTIDMIETWEWVDNAWYYQGAVRRNEFFDENPQLAKKN